MKVDTDTTMAAALRKAGIKPPLERLKEIIRTDEVIEALPGAGGEWHDAAPAKASA